MPALSPDDPFLTPEEYLASEEESPVRHEYINGLVQAMAGGSWSHRVICSNLLIRLGVQLAGKPCIPFGQDTRVRIQLAHRTFYYYPDVTVDCSGQRGGETESPSIIFEVLSDSTRRADHGDKLLNYLNLPSMRVYVLIEQKRAELIVHRRSAAGEWTMERIEGLDADLALPEIGCTLTLREIYDRVLPSSSVREDPA